MSHYIPMICPVCERGASGHGHLSEPGLRPEPGFFNLCMYCGNVNVYDLDGAGRLTLRRMVAEELVNADRELHHEVLELVLAWELLYADEHPGEPLPERNVRAFRVR